MTREKKIVSLVLVIATIAVNYLANALPLAGKTTGEVSAQFDNFFVPAGFTFFIWGFIYLGLLAYTVFPFFVKEEIQLKGYGVARIWFLISCLANMAWIFSWHYEVLGLSVAIILVLLYSLGRMWMIHFKEGESLFFKIPISVYLGWVSVATIANFSTLFTSLGWESQDGTAAFVAIIMLSITFLLALYFLQSKGDNYFTMTIMWGLMGIAGKQMDNDVMVWIMATTYIVLLFVFLVAKPIKKLLNN